MKKPKDLNGAYRLSVEAFDTTVVEMVELSRAAGGRFEVPRIGWACILFTRLCVLSKSLARLLPGSQHYGGGDHWDYSAVATLARTVLECDLMLFYLGIEDPGADEWRARLDLMHLHDATARVDLWRTLFKDAKQAEGIDQQRGELIERLRANAYFAALPERQQNHFLRGDHIRFEIQDDVLRRMGRDVEEFRSWYRVLSSHAHTYSLSFHRMTLDDRGRGVESDVEKTWIVLTLAYLVGFLDPAMHRFRALFPDIPDPRIQSKRHRPNLPPASPLWRR